MQTNPRVGIVGAGALGSTLADHLSGAGIETLVTCSHPPTALAGRLAGLGPLVLSADFEDVVSQEIVILAVPWSSIPNVLRRVADWESRVLIDATNATDAEAMQMLENMGRCSSELVADLAPGAHVVKAFNAIPAVELAERPAIGAARRAIFYAGDHQRARRQVGRLIAATGFAGIDLGGLAVGGRLLQPPTGPLYAVSLLRPPE